VSDADEGDNAHLKFSLSGKDAKLFDVNRNNGVVTASAAFAEKASYDVTVDVQDDGLQQLKNKARFAVYLAEELVVPRYIISSVVARNGFFQFSKMPQYCISNHLCHR
jgi:hypothetical protein